MNIHHIRTRTLLIAALAVAVAGNLLAAEPAPNSARGKARNAVRRETEAPKPDPVRDALNAVFKAASASWSAKDFAAVREHCGKVLARADAPPHFRSYAHLRIAQSYWAEKNPATAKAEYERITADTAYPEVHRYEAGECLKELERAAQGLPARDPEASRTKVPAIAKFAAELFVAPAGNDSNPGTRQKPFATLQKARDSVRALKAHGALPGPVAVRLSPGEYNTTKTFELTAADSGSPSSPIVYRADQPGTAVLYGGKRLNGFAPVTDAAVLDRLPAEARGKVFQCDLRKQGVDDLAPLQERGYGKQPPKATLEVFFNGQPLTLARWPNSGFVSGGKIIEPGSKKDSKPSVFEYLDDRHARWTKAEDAWLFGYFAHGWADRTLKIRSIDPATKLVSCGPYELLARTMEPVKWFNKGRIKYHVFNLLEELDQMGEWYLNRATGILYFYPPSNPAQAAVEIGMLTEPMLSMSNVAHVRIEGLVFDLSRANCLTIKNGEHCLVAGCTVKRFAGNGITINGGSDNGILGCDLYSLGRRATEVIGGDRRSLTPGRHFVENCWMHSFGRLDHTYVPAVQLEGCCNRVAHNLLGDCPSSVVRIEGNDHILEYNRVYRALLESEDQGAMELFGNPTYRGVVFRYNYFSDIGPHDAMEGPAGRAAIRLDDAISGMLIYGNIFHRAAQGFGGININGGRDNIIDNNLFAECQKGISGHYHANNKQWQRLGRDPALIMSDLYLQRYPDLRRLGTEPGLSSAWRNVFWKCGPMFNTYGRPSADKFELLTNAEYAADDPGFVDAAKGDFRLRPGAPLFEHLGFRPIPADEIGLYTHPLRASWPVDMHLLTNSRPGKPEAQTSPSTPASAPATVMIQPWRLAERDGRQCLITPAGKPFMILGLSHAGGAWQADRGASTSAEKAQRLATLKQDLRDLHFNAVGYVPELVSEFAYIHNADRLLGSPGVVTGKGQAVVKNQHLYQDVFDDAFKARLQRQVQQICAKTAGDANCIGYWWTDIPVWRLDRQKQMFGKSYVDFIRDLPDSAPGHIRYEQYKQQQGGGNDAGFLVLIARELYTATAESYRQFAPGRLLFGERYNTIPGAPLEIIAECGKVVDVVSFQPYEKTLSGAILDKVHALTGRPIMLSDWSLSFPVPGHTNTMWPQFPTDDEAAKAYETYLASAFAKPYILGYYKCQYRDAILTSGQLKQGLRAQDGKLYGGWAQSIARIHKSLLANFEKEGRFDRSP